MPHTMLKPTHDLKFIQYMTQLIQSLSNKNQAQQYNIRKCNDTKPTPVNINQKDGCKSRVISISKKVNANTFILAQCTVWFCTYCCALLDNSSGHLFGSHSASNLKMSKTQASKWDGRQHVTPIMLSLSRYGTTVHAVLTLLCRRPIQLNSNT